ncbi:cysteine desulfurase family protein [Spongisporangium articulatum]|uniref:Cysteine desulfurase family protein n=1 Tax=Spongisporangium articulatum TaxID=3362603 RepID=A0ABW8AT02_9ACTN
MVTPRVYLDGAATQPLHPAAREALLAALDDGWADPRRLHSEGRRSRALLDGAREAIAAVLGVRTDELSFTGSHTQAVHAAVLGVAGARRRAGTTVVTSTVEHPTVLHAADHVAARGGGARSDVAVDRTGAVDADTFAESVNTPGVSLACLQFANAEVGTRQPLEAAATAAAAGGVPLVVDLSACAGHVDVRGARGDVLVADPQSWGAAPGVGVLAVRAGTRWAAPGPEGDGPEAVPGGVSVPAALAAAVSLEAMVAGRAAREAEQRALVERVRRGAAQVPDTEVLGDDVHRLPHVVTFSCLYVDGEALLSELDRRGFAVGSGSACTASTLEPSHVLTAMGVLSHGNVRIGLTPATTGADVDAFLAVLPDAVATVRRELGVEGL